MTQKARRITEIIVHCSATREGKDFGAGDINVWHIARGFDCIGYHYVVRCGMLRARLPMGDRQHLRPRLHAAWHQEALECEASAHHPAKSKEPRGRRGSKGSTG